jgi:hypothetical protein
MRAQGADKRAGGADRRATGAQGARVGPPAGSVSVTVGDVDGARVSGGTACLPEQATRPPNRTRATTNGGTNRMVGVFR